MWSGRTMADVTVADPEAFVVFLIHRFAIDGDGLDRNVNNGAGLWPGCVCLALFQDLRTQVAIDTQHSTGQPSQARHSHPIPFQHTPAHPTQATAQPQPSHSPTTAQPHHNPATMQHIPASRQASKWTCAQKVVRALLSSVYELQAYNRDWMGVYSMMCTPTPSGLAGCACPWHDVDPQRTAHGMTQRSPTQHATVHVPGLSTHERGTASRCGTKRQRAR